MSTKLHANVLYPKVARREDTLTNILWRVGDVSKLFAIDDTELAEVRAQFQTWNSTGTYLVCCMHAQVRLKIPNEDNPTVIAQTLEECDGVTVATVQEVRESVIGCRKGIIRLQVCMNTFQRSSTTVRRNANEVLMQNRARLAGRLPKEQPEGEDARGNTRLFNSVARYCRAQGYEYRQGILLKDAEGVFKKWVAALWELNQINTDLLVQVPDVVEAEGWLKFAAKQQASSHKAKCQFDEQKQTYITETLKDVANAHLFKDQDMNRVISETLNLVERAS